MEKNKKLNIDFDSMDKPTQLQHMNALYARALNNLNESKESQEDFIEKSKVALDNLRLITEKSFYLNKADAEKTIDIEKVIKGSAEFLINTYQSMGNLKVIEKESEEIMKDILPAIEELKKEILKEG